jgi:hypothetical protein
MDCVSSVVRNGEKGTNVPLMSLSMLFKRSWKYLRRFLMMKMVIKRRILITYVLLLQLTNKAFSSYAEKKKDNEILRVHWQT